MTSQNNKQALQNDDYKKCMFFYELTQNVSLSHFIKTGSLNNAILRLFIGFAIIIPGVRIGYELAIIISYPARAIVLLKMPQNTETYTKIKIKMPPKIMSRSTNEISEYSFLYFCSVFNKIIIDADSQVSMPIYRLIPNACLRTNY